MIEYRYLTEKDKDILLLFSDAANHASVVTGWIQESISDQIRFKISGEFIDGQLNGILVACTMGFFLKVSEILPTWLGIRVDRIKQDVSFKDFMHQTSLLITDHFEPMNYFHHYIVRRLPKKIYSNERLLEITSEAWAQGPYKPIIERVVRTQEDFDQLPKLFKLMIGQFRVPSLVLCMNVDNTMREERLLKFQKDII